jgi:tetratricopeptide (TPR) repeat protein
MNWSRWGLTAVVCAAVAAQSPPDTRGTEVNSELAAEGQWHMDAGYALAGQGKRVEAISEYTRALALHRQSLGPRHLRTLTNMNLLASAQLMSGDVAGAEPLLAEVISIARELYPRDIQLATALGGEAYIVSTRGKLAEAQSLASEALALSLASEGEESITSAMMHGNLADIHRQAGHVDRALPLYRKARAIYEKTLDPGHPRIASLLSQEGLVLMDNNQLAMADRTMTHALEMLQRGCPACAAERWTAESNLALLRMRQCRYADADRLLTHVLAMQEAHVARPGREMAQTLQALAAVREKEQRHGEAVMLTRRADRLLAYQ